MLKISPAVELPEPIKKTFKIQPKTLLKLEAYFKLYELNYDKKADPDYVVNEIFDSFFNSDKKFVAFLKENPLPEHYEVSPKKRRSSQPKSTAEE